jgi:ABC-type transporter Mla MlaB component
MPVQLTESFGLQGDELELNEAESIKKQGIRLIEAGDGPFRVDLAELRRANSVTVAILMAWYRHARLRDKPITFVNLSQDLLNIIEFSGLRRILVGNGGNGGEEQPQ